MPPIRIEHDSDCWSTLGPSETEVQPKYYERRSSSHRSAPSMQLLHGRRHSVCKRHPRTRTWSFSFSFSRFSLMQPSLLLLPKTVACSYPEGGTWRCFVYARQMCVTKGKCVLQKKNVCLCERQMCVCKQNIIRGRRFVYERHMCVYKRQMCVLKRECGFYQRQMCICKDNIINWKMFCFMKGKCVLWKTNVCFERQMCIFKTEILETQISKGKYCKNISQNTDFTTQKANAKKGNVPFVMCLFSSWLRNICLFKREMSLLKEKCVF